MASAALGFRSRFVYADGAIREMVLWRLPRTTRERPHGFKYRLHYSSANGLAMIRYDNEAGKGDHRHIDDQQQYYHFQSVEILVDDFLRDIDQLRKR